MFVKVVGSKGYAQLFFFASIAALLYYLYFAMRGHKKFEPYNVYRCVLLLTLLVSVGCFMEPSTAVNEPVRELLLYAFVVSVMTLDLIGTTLGPIVLQNSVNPAVFKQVYQGIVGAELAARITGAMLVWLFSQGNQFVLLYPLSWCLLVAHFVLFGITVLRMHRAQSKASTKISESSPSIAVANVFESLRFIFTNPLVRVAMTAMVWATVTKFVIENVFYQSADATFSSARELASFVSVLSTVMYGLSFGLHHLINTNLNSRMQLSRLLSIQPINVLFFGSAALLLPPFWPLVLLMVTYNVIHRSIELPISRQCLVPVPGRQRSTIVSLISMIVAVVTIVTSGLMAVLKTGLILQDFIVFLLLLGSSVLFIVPSLDSYYIRNLWSLLHEERSGNWLEEPQSTSLESAPLEDLTLLNDTIRGERLGTSDQLASDRIVSDYAFSFNKTRLKETVIAHRNLLSSDKADEVLRGLRICFLSGFPWLRAQLQSATASGDPGIRSYAQKALYIEKIFSDGHRLSAISRRRIRMLAIDMLPDGSAKPHDTTCSASYISKLQILSAMSDSHTVEALTSALVDQRFSEHKSLLFECVSADEPPVSLKPIIDRMFRTDYKSAGIYRELLHALPFGKNAPEIRSILSSMLDKLNEDAAKADANADRMTVLMHTLFIDEYRLGSSEREETLIGTIAEFPDFSRDERAIVFDMHLSFLKRSEFFRHWECLLHAD